MPDMPHSESEQARSSWCSALGYRELANTATAYLTRTAIDAAALQFLKDGQWPCLEYLILRGNHIDAQGVQHLVQGCWPRLLFLGLSKECLHEDAYVVLV